jgi:hypothetical protein
MKHYWSSNILIACLLLLQLAPFAKADQNTATGNTGLLSASARLDFNIAIGKYVMLRVGDANSTQSTVVFTVALNPAQGPSNNLPYTGAFPTSSPSTKFSKTVVTTNPATTTGDIPVAAFTNVNGTRLTCSLSPLGATTPFTIGITTSGVPGTNLMTVASSAGATNLQHPSPSLTGCTNGSSQPITLLTQMGGTFTYTAGFAADTVASGTYGNLITYTATAP